MMIRQVSAATDEEFSFTETRERPLVKTGFAQCGNFNTIILSMLAVAVAFAGVWTITLKAMQLFRRARLWMKQAAEDRIRQRLARFDFRGGEHLLQ